MLIKGSEALQAVVDVVQSELTLTERTERRFFYRLIDRLALDEQDEDMVQSSETFKEALNEWRANHSDYIYDEDNDEEEA